MQRILIYVLFTGLVLVSSAACTQQNTSQAQEGENQQQSEGNRGGNNGRPGAEGRDGQAQQGIPVKVEEVTSGDISDSVQSNSTVEAEQQVQIFSRVTGIVSDLKVEEGDRVEENDILCSLEDEDLVLNESRAKAQMDKAKTDLERAQRSYDRNLITETELKNAQFQYDQAVIDWKQAKANLDYSDVRSTIDGIVFERLVQLGEKITPSDHLFSMFNPDSLVINVYIPENDYFQKIADRVSSISAEIVSDSLPDTVFNGSIKRVAPVVDAETNTLKVTVRYNDPNTVLKPGMYVKVRLIVDTHENATLVPKTAILFDNNLQYVFVVRDGKAERVPLKIGYTDALFVETLADIEPGDKVVVVGQNGLKDGTPVRIVDQE